MNKIALFGLFGVLFSLFAVENTRPVLDFDPPARIVRIDSSKELPLFSNKQINFEIVVPKDAGKPAFFAGKEMQSLLQQATANDIALVSERSKNTPYAIILGDSATSREAGIETSALTRDAFYMKSIGNNIYIVGIDDKHCDPSVLINDKGWPEYKQYYQRGTLIGVYDFLERFAGIRFYFLGELGTIVPNLQELKIPELNIFERPDCIVRFYDSTRYSESQWFGEGDPVAESNHNALRWRLQSRSIPNCHGLQHLGYFKRFGETNPEFFALKKDGARWTEYPGYLCLSNQGLRDEIFLDAKSAFSGEPASVRGVMLVLENGMEFKRWMDSCYNPQGFFNIHLMDGWYNCQCQECQKYYSGSNAEAGELIWEMTAEIARRIKNSGINDYITQMAYHFYDGVPAVSLPDNLLVQVAEHGPWDMNNEEIQQKNLLRLAAWKEKLGKKVWLWNYLLNSRSESVYGNPGAAQFSPRAVGKYYRSVQEFSAGAFVEVSLESYFPCDALNIYVAMKILWDSSLDENALIEEYYTLMFGKAADEMKEYFDEAERLWITRVAGKTINTSLGPQPLKPSLFNLWEEIYTPELLEKWTNIFDKAEKMLAEDKLPLQRTKFMRKYFLQPTLAESKKYFDSKPGFLVFAEVPLIDNAPTIDGIIDEETWAKSEILHLCRVNHEATTIEARVKVLRDQENLYIAFVSEDEHTSELLGEKLPSQASAIFHGTTFEGFFNPSGDKETFYQFAINPEGSLYTLKYPERTRWNSEISCATRKNASSFSLECAIPLKNLPQLQTSGFRANFAYNRMRQENELYSWSPFLKNKFAEFDRFIFLSFETLEKKNLLHDHDFRGLEMHGRTAGKHWAFTLDDQESGKIKFDKENFVFGGQSFYGESGRNENIINVRLAQTGIEVTPGKKYRLSYFLRAKLAPSGFLTPRVWTDKNVFIPPQLQKETISWTPFYGEFTVPEDCTTVTFGIELYGEGNFNIDQILLQEIP